MKKMQKITHKILLFVAIAVSSMLTHSCIEDGISTSPSHILAFSADTLDLGMVYTDELTVTTRFVVYNRNSKGLNISNVSLTGPAAECFRINVDGLSGPDFSDIEVRANDSIFVLADAFLPSTNSYDPVKYEAQLNFLTNGVNQQVVIKALGQDIVRLKGETITESQTLVAGKPYQITDSLVVEEGACLTIESGVKLLMHDKSRMIVRGTLNVAGTPAQPVVITGDRTGEVLPGVSFDIMSRQWDGMEFWPTSKDNNIAYAEISNTSYGVVVYGPESIDEEDQAYDTRQLVLINTKLRNSGECALAAINSSIEARGCEFAEASAGLVYLLGGNHRFDLCTFANNYLFTAISGAAITFVDPAETPEYANAPKTKALITNSIIYGIGDDVYPGDLTGWEVTMARCLFKAEGTDDANFVNSLWGIDPLFYTVRDEYHFDYRLQPESPAIGAADPMLTDKPLVDDFYGRQRALDLGAYSFDPSLSAEE